jgi:hypothetical protein
VNTADHHRDIDRIESTFGLLHRQQRAHEQACTRQQDDRKCDFGGDQHAASAAAGQPGARTRALSPLAFHFSFY